MRLPTVAFAPGVGYGHRDGCVGRGGIAGGSSGLVKATDWLLTKQMLGAGDWQIRIRMPSRAAGV